MTLAVHVQSRGNARRRLGTVSDALELIPVSRSTFYELVRTGRVPGVVKVGRRRLVDLEALDVWISQGGEAAT